MANLLGFTYALLLGFSLGMLFSYSTVLKRATLRVMEGIVWPTDLDGNESETTRDLLHGVTANIDQLSFRDSQFHSDDTTVADNLYQTVRILCLVMTYPKNHQKKAIHVNATWGKRCNKLLFVTSTADENLPTLILHVKEGRHYLGDKTREAFNHAYEHYLADYDWFLKADDDTYVIMENLRYFLSAQDHKSPVFFGHTFTVHMTEDYASGGAGYVASREALRRYGLRSNQTPGCEFNSIAEDRDFGRCMESLGVNLGDSLDAFGRTRFHCLRMESHIGGFYPNWYNSRDKYNGTKKGPDALSDYTISFHYVDPVDMYLMEYFVYHLNPYGIIKGLQHLNSIQSNDKMV